MLPQKLSTKVTQTRMAQTSYRDHSYVVVVHVVNYTVHYSLA